MAPLPSFCPRALSALVALGLLVTVTTGCSAQPPQLSTTTIAGCWLQAAGKPACGDLISRYGKPPGEAEVNLPGTVRIFSYGEVDNGRLIIHSTFNGCYPTTIPVWIRGNTWAPDADNSVLIAVQCVMQSPGYDTYTDQGWITDFFAHKFQVSFPDEQSVRFQSSKAYIVFNWD